MSSAPFNLKLKKDAVYRMNGLKIINDFPTNGTNVKITMQIQILNVAVETVMC